MTQSEDLFKEWLKDADPVVREMFPAEQDVVDVAKHLKTVRFRTRYNCLVDDAEHPDPVSVVAPGRSESLDHLVQRLTGKANPTMRDLTRLAMGDEFEDPSEMSEQDIDDRFERVVAQGDRLDAEDALAAAVSDFSNAQAEAVASENARATQEQARTNNADASAVPGVSGQDKADASAT